MRSPFHHPTGGLPPGEAEPRGEERLFARGASRLAGLTGLLLGWRPGEFWAATPAEVATVLGAIGGEVEGISGDELRQLCALFPD